MCALSSSRGVQTFRPLSKEIKKCPSISEIAIAPHRNAMRARYKDRPKKSTNGVGMITPLHMSVLHALYSDQFIGLRKCAKSVSESHCGIICNFLHFDGSTALLLQSFDRLIINNKVFSTVRYLCGKSFLPNQWLMSTV